MSEPSAKVNERVIWKFPLSITDRQIITIPRVHKLLTVQVQNGEAMLWAIVNPKSAVIRKCIDCHGTGNPGADLDSEYLGTVQMNGFVWHFFVEEHSNA